MFTVERVMGDGLITVKVAGDIDLATTEKFTESLESAIAQAAKVQVDLSEVTFLDSTGIRALVQGYRSAQSRGGTFHVVGAKHWVAKVLDVTGVGPLLTPPQEG